MRNTLFLATALFLMSTMTKAQNISIPDINFKNKLLSASSSNSVAKDLNGIFFKIDTNNDGDIQESEALNVTFLDVDSSQITDITGIQSFTNLIGLECSSNKLKTLNLTFLNKIESLTCDDNLLETITIGDFSKLKSILCGYNQLTNLDLKSAKELQNLKCYYNKLTSLNLSENKALLYLYCGFNKIESLDLSNMPMLTIVECESNLLNTLDLTNSNNVYTLNCNKNLLKVLDVSKLTYLSTINCSNNSIQNLSLSGLSIYELNCSFNLINDLDISNFNLREVNVSNNNISLLDFTKSTNLTKLDCSSNKLTSLVIPSQGNLTSLSCSSNQIESLNLNNATNLNFLNCNNNLITNLNITGLEGITSLSCSDNKLKGLDITKLKKIYNLDCDKNELQTLEFSNNISLKYLNCSANLFTTLDLNHLVNLSQVQCNNSKNLESFFAKNGMFLYLDLTANTNLKYICVIEPYVSSVKYFLNNRWGISNCSVNSYCSLTPGGNFYTIQGTTRFDEDNNGCDTSDRLLSNLKFSITNGDTKSAFITDDKGIYSMLLQGGTYQIEPILENNTSFSIDPKVFSITLSGGNTSITQDFCISKIQSTDDLEINLLPLENAIPGFDANYKLVYKNKGTNTQSGSIVFHYQDDKTDFVSASPTVSNQGTNELTWNFFDLKPFEEQEILIKLNLNKSTDTPALNDGDQLLFTANINSNETDINPLDNIATLNQKVVNSHDPNDKTCLEGTIVTEDIIGKEVHYLIRFENTGTFPAKNIIVEDVIDLSKFDISTLIPTSASHSFVTKISGNNKVELVFENCNLPFDDANNDGYIAFKIKTLSSLVVGDTFSNTAAIYFDYNFPVITNDAITAIQKPLGIDDFKFSNLFNVFPNPVKDALTIVSKDNLEVTDFNIYNMLGQQVMAVSNVKPNQSLDVSRLRIGTYIIKATTAKGTATIKFVKE